MNTPQSFSSWMTTHESECRNLVKLIFAANKGAVRFGIDADDLWHETFRRLSKSDQMIASLLDLCGLVKTIATRIVCDKARRYAVRKPLFDKPEVTTTSGDFFDDPADPGHTPDEAILSEEQMQLLHDIAVGDHAVSAIFRAICELVDADIPASVTNISRHLGTPYGQVRAAHIKLQRLIRMAMTAGHIGIAKEWLS